MKLSYNQEPIVGQPFRVEARGGSGSIHLRIIIGQRMVREKDCPDEPCHEMIVVPPRSAGRTLQVVARDSRGVTEELEFTIRDKARGQMALGAAG